MRYHLLAPTPISQWVSEWFIVSDLEIAIASPSFASLFFGGSFLNWSSLSWSALGVGVLRPGLTMWWQHQDNVTLVLQIRNTKPARLRFCIQYSVFVKLNQNSIKYCHSGCYANATMFADFNGCNTCDLFWVLSKTSLIKFQGCFSYEIENAEPTRSP